MTRLNIFLLCFAALCLFACQERATRAEARVETRAVEVRTTTLTEEPFTESVRITGTLVSRTRVDVKAETTGRVVRFSKEEGDRVEAGEPLVWVDEENYKLALRQQETVVQVAEAGLERSRVLEQHSRAELERAENLLKSGGITDKDWKAAQVAALDARAQVALAEAQIEQARAAVEMARKRLRDTVIHSPVLGHIERRYINPGAFVEPPTPVFTVVDNQRLEIESPIASAELAPVRPGQRATFTVNAYPGVAFEGRVVEVNPAVEPESRSARVRIQADNRSGRLKAGMFAEGDVLTGAQAEAIMIPASAVYREDGSSKSSYAYVVENGTAVRRDVRIGREKDGRLQILEGLKPGDALISEQSIEVAGGVPVSVSEQRR
jgi:RND family efflux transporter MFP subunit